MTRPLTPARRHALLVLAVGRRSGRLVRSSTATSRLGELLDHDDRRPLRIYHQTAEWLATQGWVDRNDIGTLTLTNTGLKAAEPVEQLFDRPPAER